jgi:hypothetical protein
LNVALWSQLASGRGPDHQLQPARLHGLNHGQTGLAACAPLGRQTDQVTGMEANLGQGGFSLRDSRRARGPRSGPASQHW